MIKCKHITHSLNPSLSSLPSSPHSFTHSLTHSLTPSPTLPYLGLQLVLISPVTEGTNSVHVEAVLSHAHCVHPLPLLGNLIVVMVGGGK